MADTAPPRPRAASVPGARAPLRALLLPAGVFLLALLVLLQYGLRGAMDRDGAALLYAGQQLAEGVPPYRSAATLKGPVAQLVAGAAVAAARAAGRDEVAAVRLLFLSLAALTVALVATLAREAAGSPRAGILAALVLLGSLGYTRLAAAGPCYNTVTLLFLVVGLLLTERRRWLPAGAAGSLAYLTWQPAALLPAATLLLAALEHRRGRAVAAAAAGVAVPVAGVLAWGVYQGFLGELALRILLFDLPYLERGSAGLAEHLRGPVATVARGYGAAMVAATGAALVAVLLEARARRRRSASWAAALREGRGSALLLTFPAFLLWSLLDFQGVDDFFPLLPGVAVACGALLDRFLPVLGRALAGSRPRSGAWLGGAAAACGLLGVLVLARGNRGSGLDAQVAAAREIARRYPDRRLVSVGDPVPLVLLRRRNPNPHLFIASGADELIERRTPGGFGGWLEGLRAGGPILVLGGRMRGERRRQLRRWLAAGFRRERIGPTRLFVERGR